MFSCEGLVPKTVSTVDGTPAPLDTLVMLVDPVRPRLEPWSGHLVPSHAAAPRQSSHDAPAEQSVHPADRGGVVVVLLEPMASQARQLCGPRCESLRSGLLDRHNTTACPPSLTTPPPLVITQFPWRMFFPP